MEKRRRALEEMVMSALSFWKAKKVLITGHTGFKGSWLSVLLHKLGAQVTGYALGPRTAHDHFTACGVGSLLADVRGDIRDVARLKAAFARYEPQIVFHLAAQPIVLASYEDAKGTYETNVMGTLHLLECVKECAQTKCAVVATTDKCYENQEQIWGYREDDRLGGNDPYSSSKACVELLVSSYRHSFFHSAGREKALASARAGNVIGGGDWAQGRIVPDCVRALARSGKIELRSPNAVRPWQHVLEALYGYLLLAKKLYLFGGAYAEAWNFGPDPAEVLRVQELAELLIHEFGRGEIAPSQRRLPSETGFLTLDSTKAARRLGWRPVWPVRQAVEMTAAWYKRYGESKGGPEAKAEMRALCEAQIEEYLAKAGG